MQRRVANRLGIAYVCAPVKILIAPDKFKGCLSATEVALAISRGLASVWPTANIVRKPIADGGEGFADTLSTWTVEAGVHDALGREVTASYGWISRGTAVIEMSAASGLWRIAPGERDPLRASTAGTGELMLDAIARGAFEVLLGIGGSATNDGGIGMAAVLGYEFLGSDGEPLEPIPANLTRLNAIRAPVTETRLPRIVAACDVDNPLLGADGATSIYGPQKGVTPELMPVLEAGLERLADVVARDLGRDFRNTPGSGAAGGLGFGLLSFFGADIRSGFDLVAEYSGLEEVLSTSDLVITAEGKIDTQTLHGKGPAGVADLAHKHGKPLIAFAGIHEKESAAATLAKFDAVFEINRPDVPLEVAIRNAAGLLQELVRDVAAGINAGSILPELTNRLRTSQTL